MKHGAIRWAILPLMLFPLVAVHAAGQPRCRWFSTRSVWFWENDRSAAMLYSAMAVPCRPLPFVTVTPCDHGSMDRRCSTPAPIIASHRRAGTLVRSAGQKFASRASTRSSRMALTASWPSGSAKVIASSGEIPASRF